MSDEEAGKYREKYAVYAARYDSTPRTVKRWVATGRENHDPCPLDDAEKMMGWWPQNMSQRCPDKILAVAVEARKQRATEKGEPEPVAEVAEMPVPVTSGKKLPPAPLLELPIAKQKEVPTMIPRELQPVGLEEVGVEATLKRLQEAEVHAHRIYLKALEDGNDGLAKLALKSFTDLAAQVAAVEQKAIAQRVLTRDLVPRLEAEGIMSDFHQNFHGLLRGSGDSFCRAFGIPVTAENDEKWNLLIDSVCEQLQQEVFQEQ